MREFSLRIPDTRLKFAHFCSRAHTFSLHTSKVRQAVRVIIGPLWLVAALLCVSGCAQTPRVLQYDAMDAAAAVWPAPPDSPRFRFVGQLTGEENFQRPEDARENFVLRALRWVVGLASGRPLPNILQRPQSGYVDDQGRIFVTDVSRPGVAVFDTVAGSFRLLELATAEMPFQTPIAIIAGPNSELLVTDSQLGIVARLSASGEPRGFFGKGELKQPTGMARDPLRGRIYVSDTREHNIKIYDETFRLVGTIGKKGDQPGEFNSPTHLAFANNVLYVSDTLNSRIQMMNPDGAVLKVFGERGLFVGNMPRPKGLAVDSMGLIYIVETFYDHLLVFNQNGEFLMPIGGSGYGPGQFYLPAGVFVDNNKRVYVADMFNGRVAVFEFIGEGL